MNLYETDNEARQFLRAFICLAILPIDRINEGYAILKQKVEVSLQAIELIPFIIYFENEWMNVFKPSTWSVGKSTWRTNNYAE
ncbi:unnamed protein product, partial [Rotaria sp. Silwood1]